MFSTFFLATVIVLIISIATNIALAIYKSWLKRKFYLGCSHHLMQAAANAGSIAIVKRELYAALTWAYQHDLTSGNTSFSTSILFHEPRNDLSVWYDNINAIYNKLNRLHDDSSATEWHFMLETIRECVCASHYPCNIELFPHHKTIAWIEIASLIVATASVAATIVIASLV